MSAASCGASRRNDSAAKKCLCRWKRPGQRRPSDWRPAATALGLANLWRTRGVTTFNKSGHLLLTWIVEAALVGVRGRTKWTQARFATAAPPPAQYANRPEGLRWPGVHFSPRSLWDNSISAAEDMVSAASSNNRFQHAYSSNATQ